MKVKKRLFFSLKRIQKWSTCLRILFSLPSVSVRVLYELELRLPIENFMTLY